jgi:hybrid cluster-associated redox disulfide protein
MFGRMFTSTTNVSEALQNHPNPRWVFAAYHLGGCNGCSRANDETLAELAEGYRIELESFLRDLNSLLATAAG